MDLENIKTIINGNSKDMCKLLDIFIENADKVFVFPNLTDDLRKDLWRSLYQLVESTSDVQTKANCFSALRILSREKKLLDNLIEECDWLETIKKCSGFGSSSFKFDNNNKVVAIEAEKCLCNLVFNSRKVASSCCKNGTLHGINNRIPLYNDASFPSEIKFFDIKLMFIITAMCSDIRTPFRNETNAIDNLMLILNDTITKLSIVDSDSVDFSCEILKALFNLTLNFGNDDKEIKKCKELTAILRKCLIVETSSEQKRWALHNNVINLLTNIPNECLSELTPAITPNDKSVSVEFNGHNLHAFKEILVLLKVKLVNDGSVSDQHEILSPIVTVLYKGSCANRSIRKYLRNQILPPLKDVHKRPEEGTTLRNCLCRLLTTPMTQLRDVVAEFLFVLCKKSVSRMIKYTGYGNAAGLFAQRGLLGGREDSEAADFSSDSGDSETEEYALHKDKINPVLGCYEPSHPDAMEGMTDEQKEYEAMKLVQLMDDLTRSGTIQPCRVGANGKPEPIEHVLQLQEGLKNNHINGGDSDSE